MVELDLLVDELFEFACAQAVQLKVKLERGNRLGLYRLLRLAVQLCKERMSKRLLDGDALVCIVG